MKNQVVLIAGIALLLGGIGGYAFSKSERYEQGFMMGDWGDRRDRDDDSFTNKKGTEDTSMGGMHNMHGAGSATTERAFIQAMIPHHQEAVDTAKQVVARGENAEAKKLAENIIAAQEKEIADMKTWYKTWYGVDYAEDGKYNPMMRDLSKFSGIELDKAFLEDMIMHHMGALMMAQSVNSYIEHQEIRTLAEGIAKSQSEEIVTMRVLLKQF